MRTRIGALIEPTVAVRAGVSGAFISRLRGWSCSCSGPHYVTKTQETSSIDAALVAPIEMDTTTGRGTTLSHEKASK